MENNEFIFSIIVPVYNTEKYVKKCLESIQRAMDVDCEVIIINDGSTDNSEELIMKFIKELPEKYKNNYIYIKKENKGLADTKNVGIEMARGKYISVVDSDDYISEDFYNIARKFINKFDIIIYDLYVVFEENVLWNHTIRAVNESQENKALGYLTGAMSGSSCNKIIKKELYSNLKFPVGREYEDVGVTPFILIQAKSIKYVPYPLYYYLQRKNSIVSNNTEVEAFYKMRRNTSDVLKKQENIEEYKILINEYYVKPFYNILISDFYTNKKNFENNLKKFLIENKEIIEYILKNNIIDTQKNNYTNRQKENLKKIYLWLLEEKYSNIKNFFIKKNILEYFRNLKFTFQQFLKGIINKR